MSLGLDSLVRLQMILIKFLQDRKIQLRVLPRLEIDDPSGSSLANISVEPLQPQYQQFG